MNQPSSPPTDAPHPHEGVRYPNPSSKPLEGPVGQADRETTQRLVWKLFFVLMLCTFAMVIVIGLISRRP
jgi:hypothetical protein